MPLQGHKTFKWWYLVFHHINKNWLIPVQFQIALKFLCVIGVEFGGSPGRAPNNFKTPLPPSIITTFPPIYWYCPLIFLIRLRQCPVYRVALIAGPMSFTSSISFLDPSDFLIQSWIWILFVCSLPVSIKIVCLIVIGCPTTAWASPPYILGWPELLGLDGSTLVPLLKQLWSLVVGGRDVTVVLAIVVQPLHSAVLCAN